MDSILGLGTQTAKAKLNKANGKDKAFNFESNADLVRHFKEFEGELCLIDKWILSEGIGWVIAKSGVGKTNFVIDLCYHVASGYDWYGNKTKQGTVRYFALEGGKLGIALRHASIEQAKPKMYAASLGYFHSSREEFNLNEREDTDRLIKQYKGQETSLLIYDTLSEAHNLKEDSNSDIQPIIANIKKISKALKCFVLLIHHFGKDETKGGRGASRWKGSMDLELTLIETGNGGFSVADTKQKDMPKHHEPLYFNTNVIDLQNNKKEVFQGVVVEEGVPSDPAHTTSHNKIMDCVREHQATGSGELFVKDVVKATGLFQSQVSRDVGKLVNKGRLAYTSEGGIFMPKK